MHNWAMKNIVWRMPNEMMNYKESCKQKSVSCSVLQVMKASATNMTNNHMSRATQKGPLA